MLAPPEIAVEPGRADGGAARTVGAVVTTGTLVGLRVLDLTIWRPGPYATQLLAEQGADVLKVEPPGGDPMRSMPDLFDILGADKRSIVLDLTTEAGRARCLELAEDASGPLVRFTARPGHPPFGAPEPDSSADEGWLPTTQDGTGA